MRYGAILCDLHKDEYNKTHAHEWSQFSVCVCVWGGAYKQTVVNTDSFLMTVTWEKLSPCYHLSLKKKVLILQHVE